jgi:Peptidase family C25/Propeptide_C25/FlgD Ig-like domain
MRNLLIVFLVILSFSLFANLNQAVQYNDSWGEQGFTLESQSSFGIQVNHSIQNFIMEEQMINREMLQTINLPGNFLPNDEGMPDLPGEGRYIAIPQGARAELRILEFRTESFSNIEMAPAFRIPLDTDDEPLDYNRNNQVYSTNAFYPSEIATISEPTQIRGIDVVMLGITPFQYNPVTKELVVYHDVKVEVNFVGGNGQIGVERLRSRWWDPILQDAILNHEIIPVIDYSQRENTRDGFEYLIISPDDPIFLTWADSIKVFRQQQGISTTVMTTAQVGGNTPTAIESYINSIMDPNTGWDPAPAAVLILGDYGTTGSTVVAPIWDNYCASDNIYADVNGNSMPDIVFARMTAQNETHLNTMITKFLNYERNPPTNPNFYANPITALGWQTERWFQICSETVGGFWTNEQGKTPVRVNAVYGGNPNTDPWSTATNTATVLNYFGPNGLGYIPESPSTLGGWTGGNATMVNNAINNGAFMLQHRDHGYEQGWGEPAYSSTNINGLTNTDLVFVLSINCLTGKYNMAGECFSEKFHRYTYNGENSGALGLTIASEVSYSFVNDTFVWGLYDNLWPNFMPDYGTTPDSRDVLPAFGMAAGKYFLQQSSWPYNTNNKEVTYNLFHHFGDAFSTVYSEVPQDLTVLHDPVLLGGIDSYTVMADDGSFIALTVNNQIIGTADGTGAPISMSIDPQLPGEDMLVTVTKQNYYRYSSLVPVIPPTGSYVVFDEMIIDDSAGNGNGLVEFSENITLSIDVENIGTVNATNVNIAISTTDDNVTITDDNESYGTVNAGAVASITDGFAVSVEDNVSDQHNVIFEMIATNGTETWTSYFSIILYAPILEIGDMLIDDSNGNNNGAMDPGETVVVTIPVLNEGLADSPDAIATLTCPSAGISIEIETINLGSITSETNEDAVYNVTADASIPFGTPITLNFGVVAGAFEATEDFPAQVGIHREDFEYGFSQYPWEFQGYDITWSNDDIILGNPIANVDWSIDPSEFYSGVASAKSSIVTHNQASFMSITLDVTVDGEISFWYKVACEYSPSQEFFYDGLFFMIDGEKVGEFQPEGDGSSPWSFANYNVEVGTHTFDWIYVKDGSDGSTMIPDDCAWVDYITFPSITALATSSIAGTVSVIPAANLADVEISVGATTVNPDASGQFSFEIPVGIHDITASLEGYETITIEDVEVLENQVSAVSFELHYLQVPENLECVLEIDVVSLVWEHEQPTDNSRKNQVISNREFQSFNIYRNVDGGTFEVLASTTELTYDDILENAGEYNYYITAIYEQENESDASNLEVVIWDGTDTGNPLVPITNALHQNSPNPFNPETKISFDLRSDSKVILEIYNMKGQKVRQIVNNQLSSGQHFVVWNGRDDNNKKVSSGIYFYKMKTSDFQATKKMLLMK